MQGHAAAILEHLLAGRVIMVSAHKCKKSVFCVFFLICFFIGTICGVFCSRCISVSLSGVERFSLDFSSLKVAVFTVLRPLALVAVLGCLSNRKRYVCICIVLRGFLTAYLFSAVRASEHVWEFAVKELLVLLLFYWLCSWSYFRQDSFCRIS